jgi:hypothetical protein
LAVATIRRPGLDDSEERVKKITAPLDEMLLDVFYFYYTLCAFC